MPMIEFKMIKAFGLGVMVEWVRYMGVTFIIGPFQISFGAYND